LLAPLRRQVAHERARSPLGLSFVPPVQAMSEPLAPGESWGLFTNTIAYEVTRDVKPHVLSMGVAVFVGAACGVTAALFTRTNLKWCAANEDWHSNHTQ